MVPNSFAEFRKIVAKYANKHGFRNVAYLLADVDYEGEAVQAAYDTWNNLQSEWAYEQTETPGQATFWEFAEDFVGDMLIDMNDDLEAYGYEQDFPIDQWEEEPDTSDLENAAFQVSRALASLRESLNRRDVLRESAGQPVKIGELYANVADDQDYASSLTVLVDPGTGNVELNLREVSPIGGMDMRAGQDVRNQRVAQLGVADAKTLLRAIRIAINNDSILKRYGKPTRNFVWYAGARQVGKGLNVGLAKQALMYVMDPQKWEKTYAQEPEVKMGATTGVTTGMMTVYPPGTSMSGDLEVDSPERDGDQTVYGWGFTVHTDSVDTPPNAQEVAAAVEHAFKTEVGIDPNAPQGLVDIMKGGTDWVWSGFYEVWDV